MRSRGSVRCDTDAPFDMAVKDFGVFRVRGEGPPFHSEAEADDRLTPPGSIAS